MVTQILYGQVEKSLFQDVCRPLLHILTTNAPDVQKEDAIKKFLKIPRQTLTRRRGSNNQQKNVILARLNAILHNIPHEEQQHPQHNNNNELKRTPDMVKRTNRAAFFVSQNQISKAARALVTPPLASSHTDEERLDIITKVSTLLPTHPIDPLPSQRSFDCPLPLVALDDKALSEAISQITNKSAPGQSGWTGELLATLCEDEACKAGLKQLLLMIINNSCSRDIKQLLNTSRLVPAKKGVNGIRPILVGEPVVKLATSYIIKMTKDPISACFPTIQHGVGDPGGSEKALHLIQATLDNLKHNNVDKPCVLQLDIKNAFNSLSRHNIAQALAANPSLSSHYRIFSFLNDSSSPIILTHPSESKTHIICLNDTVKQGENLSACHFSLRMQSIYAEAVAGLPDTHAVAVIDDLHIIGPLANVMIAFDRLRTLLDRVHLELVLPKCNLLMPQSNLPPAVMDAYARAATQAGINMKQVWMEVLGGLVGELSPNDPTLRAWFDTYLQEYDVFFDAIALMKKQHAYHVLKKSMIPRLSFLLRVCPPSLLRSCEVLQRFDEKVLTAFKKLINTTLPITPAQHTQISLPVDIGGMGLRRTADIADTAFLSSLSQIFPNIYRLYNIQDIHELLISQMSAAREGHRAIIQKLSILNIHEEKKEEKYTQHIPISFHDFTRKHREGNTKSLQKHITQYVDLSTLQTMKQDINIDIIHKKRMENLAYKGASTIYNAVPSKPEYTLSCNHFEICARSRLGFVPFDQLTALSCKCDCADRNTPDHIQSCIKEAKRSHNLRHNAVTHALQRLCVTVGIAAEREPKLTARPQAQRDDQPLQHLTKKRPDLKISTPFSDTFIDVSIIHSTSSTYMDRPLSTALQQRANQKITKYRRVGVEPVRPFVLDSYGAKHSEVDKIIKTIKQGALINKSSFTKHARLTLAFALQRGNAEAIRWGAAHMYH
jgi:hypothetical protein